MSTTDIGRATRDAESARVAPEGLSWRALVIAGMLTIACGVWVRQAEKDTGRRPGATTDELVELKRLKRENAELRRANDILKAAAHFFGAELDRQSKK